MPIIIEQIEEKTTTVFQEAEDWVHSLQNNLDRIPIDGFLQNNATFKDDEYFGDNDY